MRVTDQNKRFRYIWSPIEGTGSRVKSYSKSPSGNRITNAFAGKSHLSLLLLNSRAAFQVPWFAMPETVPAIT